MAIPVIDLFAGPGGLGEGFGSLERNREAAFKVMLSIEKDSAAFQTLRLRNFFREFGLGGAPDSYYDLLRGKITTSDLFAAYPEEAQRTAVRTWQATLGAANLDSKELDRRIYEATHQNDRWVLIGGPPRGRHRSFFQRNQTP